MEITLIYHPYLTRGPKKYIVDGPLSVKDFCDKFNIALKMLPRRNAVGSHTPIISINKISKNINENSIISVDSTLSIMGTWILGSGPAESNEEFQSRIERLKAQGRGIGGIPPFEETESIVDIVNGGKLIIGDY